jgi:NTE family protein
MVVDDRSHVRVFIAHEHDHDRDDAVRLAKDLKKHGAAAWLAEESIRGGEDWITGIERGIRECTHFLVVVTPQAVASTWVKKEAAIAINSNLSEGRPEFIPLERKPAVAHPFWTTYQMIQFQDYQQGLVVLLDTLGLSGKEIPPPPRERKDLRKRPRPATTTRDRSTSVAPTSGSVERRIDVVAEAGGVKALALAGAFSVLDAQGFDIQNLAGVSGGALLSVLLAAGFSASETSEILRSLDFERLLERQGWARLPLVGRRGEPELGGSEGRYFLEFVAHLLEAKGVQTFGDLLLEDATDRPGYRYKAQVLASDLTERRLLLLPKDAPMLGMEPNELSVALAVRMSMSVPGVFAAVRFTNPATKETHYIMDGGIFSNFPVWLFDAKSAPVWPTIGVKTFDADPRISIAERVQTTSLGSRRFAERDALRVIVQAGLEKNDRLPMDQADLSRTIAIPTLGVRATDFSMSEETADVLFQSGRQAAEEFLETWDFFEYVERIHPVHSGDSQ